MKKISSIFASLSIFGVRWRLLLFLFFFFVLKLLLFSFFLGGLLRLFYCCGIFGSSITVFPSLQFWSHCVLLVGSEISTNYRSFIIFYDTLYVSRDVLSSPSTFFLIFTFRPPFVCHCLYICSPSLSSEFMFSVFLPMLFFSLFLLFCLTSSIRQFKTFFLSSVWFFSFLLCLIL